MHQKTKTKISEYIEMLNNGYYTTKVDNETTFSTGEPVGYFWHSKKNAIILEFETNPKYKEGYEKAWKAIYCGKPSVYNGPLTAYEKMNQYIEKLNNGYIPKKEDKEEKFSSGEIVNQFWLRNKKKVKEQLETKPKYQEGYEVAKKVIENEFMKSSKNRLSIAEKREEYIDKLNNGYIPRANDIVEKFSNGDGIMQFWRHNKEAISTELEENPRYKEGYDKAREMINFDKMIEYIELLNSGYIPKPNDIINHFSNGQTIGRYWNVYQGRIKQALDTNPKYKTGYDVARSVVNNKKAISKMIKAAKNNAKGNANSRTPELKNEYSIMEILEYFNIDIETLNECIMRINKSFESPIFQPDDTLEAYCNRNNFDYQTIYKAVKLKKFCPNDTLEQLLNRIIIYNSTTIVSEPPTWITENYGVEIKAKILYLQLDYSEIIRDMTQNINTLEQSIKEYIYNQFVEQQNPNVKTAYMFIAENLDACKTREKMTEVLTKMKNDYLNTIYYTLIRRAINEYMDVMCKYRIIDVALERNKKLKLQKMQKYSFDEFDVEESCLIDFDFKNGHIITADCELYNRRQLLRQYTIDWEWYTDEEKQEIIKENKIGARELKLINTVSEKIIQTKEHVKVLTKI